MLIRLDKRSIKVSSLYMVMNFITVANLEAFRNLNHVMIMDLVILIFPPINPWIFVSTNQFSFKHYLKYIEFERNFKVWNEWQLLNFSLQNIKHHWKLSIPFFFFLITRRIIIHSWLLHKSNRPTKFDCYINKEIQN